MFSQSNNVTKISKQYYDITLGKTREIRKYAAKEIEYIIKFKNIPAELIESLEMVENLFTLIIKDLRFYLKPDDSVKIYIDHPNFDGGDINTRFHKGCDLDANVIINTITRLAQSGKILSLDDRLTLSALIMNYKTGSGLKRVADYLYKKQCVVRIKETNDDKLCGLRAICVGKAYADNDNYETMRDSRNSLQTRKAYEIAFKLNLNINEPLGFNQIREVEKYLHDYQIIILNGDNANEFDYVGPQKDKKIVLYLKDNHYDFVKSLPAFLNKYYFCYKCLKGYSVYENHPCNEVCKKCKDRNCTLTEYSNIKCEFCGVYCKSNECLMNHRVKVCGNFSKCEFCSSFKLPHHVCQGKWCVYCKTEVTFDHQCYILTEEENAKINKHSVKTTLGYIFFDYEAMQTEEGHVVNLVCARKICLDCIDNNECNLNCGDFFWKTNNLFCEWLFSKSNANFIAIAHNMKSYDGYFIINYIVSNILPNERLPEILLTGSKILLIKFCKVTIKDSINFIPMSLAKFPKTFDLNELKKGYFPHYFNTPQNQNYEGKYPETKYYGPDLMSHADREKFLFWHTKQKGLFNLQTELLEYCKSDVDILAKACLSFRKLFLEITKTNSNDCGVDPFVQCITLPSSCHYVFRRNFMTPKSIGLIPPFGYAFEPSSYKAVIWLRFLAITENINIKHSRNGLEKRISDYKVDGWDSDSSTVFEFNGCLFHGCPQCFRPESFNVMKNETMRETYRKHVLRISNIKNSSEVKHVRELWECEFDKKIKGDPAFAAFVKNESYKKPLDPRDSLAGGRTNAFILYNQGHMGYVDFTSLYPYIQKYGIFPLGHPKIIVENFESVESYFGLIFCKILPPKDLYIPVLPYKTNNKLMFPLCSTCCVENMLKCDHSDELRCLEGTWVTLEVIEALKLGYKIIRIYEVWHYEDKTQYNPTEKNGGLFTNYVNTFLKIKQEASGYPDWVNTEDDKNKYINNYFQHEGILLDKNNIKVNSGLKALSKLLLNSQWGRYAMNTDKTKCKFITQPFQLFDLMNTDQYEVTDVVFPNDEIGICYYKDAKDMHIGSNQTNVVIAAFVTCQARLKLYDELRKIGKDLVYCDTDSVFYIKGRYSPVLGDYLGMFTNEIDPNEGTEIVEFASAGPKNYSYKLDSGITYTKVKGFDLNFSASKKIDFEKIKEIVKNPSETKTIALEQSNIKRNKNDWTVHTNNIEKIYRLVYDKRIILPDLSTIPFGYIIE